MDKEIDKPSKQTDFSTQEKILAEVDKITDQIDRGEISVKDAEIETKRLFLSLEEDFRKTPENYRIAKFKARTQAFKVLLLASLLFILFCIVAFRPILREYKVYLFDSHPGTDFTFDELSEEWSEDDLKSKFNPLELTCYDDDTLGKMGDRSCYAHIQRHNNIPAMLVVFFLNHGKLETASIHVPKWAHYEMREDLLRLHGRPTLKRTGDNSLLNEWTLANHSQLFYNNSTSAGLQWSAIFWISNRALKNNVMDLVEQE